jgi:hypothetical protein
MAAFDIEPTRMKMSDQRIETAVVRDDVKTSEQGKN